MPKRIRLLLPFLLVSLACVFSGATADEATPSRPKNVILISLDATRADHLSCYGYRRTTTPFIDALARDGVIFLNAFSHSPKTPQSHMSMMTSLHHIVHRVCLWEDYDVPLRLADTIPTLAGTLKSHGYATAAFTSGGGVHATLGFDRGFDIYLQDGRPEKAFTWLEENREKKFFIFFHDVRIHDPYLPPAPYNRMYYRDYAGGVSDAREELFARAGEKGLQWWSRLHDLYWETVDVRNQDDIRFLIAQYDAQIRMVDEEFIRPLVEHLKKLKLYADTLIIVTADHGEAFKEHGLFRHDAVFLETMHVPLIMANAAAFGRDKKVNQLVRLIDIMPTVLDLVGVPLAAPVQGVSLIPALRGEDLGLTCFSSNKGMRALRTSAYGYVLKRGPPEPPEYLFDRQRDPGETRNLIAQMPEVAARLREELERQERDCRVRATHSRPTPTQFDSETVDKFRSLGYVQ